MKLAGGLGVCVALGAAFVGLHRESSAAASAFRTYCTGPDMAVAMSDPLGLAERELAPSESPRQLKSDVASAKAAITKVDELRHRLNAGGTVGPAYASAEHFQRLSRAASDPLVAELFRRVATDQFARSHVTAANSRADWAKGLSDGALRIAYAVVSTRDWCGTDARNTGWLKQQLRSHGWFKRSTDGADADGAAFLLVQHADADQPFQKQILALMEPLAAAGEARPANYALLFDRVAVGEGRPQRYGSQGRCTGTGTWTEFPVEHPDALDQERAKMGLEPMADYRRRFVQVCP